VILAATLIAYGWLGAAERNRALLGARLLPRIALLALVVLGAGTALIGSARDLGFAGDPRDSGVTAAIRSIVLALGAVVLAVVYRRSGLREMRGTALVLLLLGGLKLLFRDVPTGRPVTLFPTFLAYGAALLLVPRLLRGGTTEPAASPLLSDRPGDDR